ncbi:hypothetical protein ACFCWT_13255 [Streptomyces olivaceus]|uniref:hypothetical protein n=1 Tax=Streptomyces olivaceus TaxID=47716 RepID=UPI0035E23B67
MTGPEHYREAERLLQGLMTERGSVYVEEGNEQVIGVAQAHATLALAAATALSAPDRGATNVAVRSDRRAWNAAAGVTIPEGDDA